MFRIVWSACLAIGLVGCGGNEKVAMTGEEPVEAADFIEFFPERALPMAVSDTHLLKKRSDSLQIAHTIVQQFVPDSIFQKDFGKTTPKFFALGRTQEKNKETYLLIEAVAAKKSAAYLVAFDRKNQYLCALPLVRKGFDNLYSYAAGSLDKKFQITVYREKKTKTGESNFKRNVYIYNSANNEFTLILTEPNEEMISEVYNPIDTLSQKNKYTGDYVANKKNFISFRDGKTPSELQFFVHFEKSDGECVGELKGVARMVSGRKAVYHQSGNPCTIEFTFNANSVVMKEEEGCGGYRGIKCFFEGTFPKKKSKK